MRLPQIDTCLLAAFLLVLLVVALSVESAADSRPRVEDGDEARRQRSTSNQQEFAATCKFYILLIKKIGSGEHFSHEK